MNPAVTVYAQTFRGYRWPLIILGAGLFAFSFILCYTFQAFGGAEGLTGFLDNLPAGIRALVNAIGFREPTAESYVANTYQDPRFLIIVCAFVIGNAASALAGEVERGTALYLLSRPISRVQVVLAKMAALATGLVILLLAAFAGTVVGAAANGFLGQLDLSEFLRVLVMVLALMWLIASVAFLLSARASDRGHVLSVSAGIFVTLYFIDFVAGIWSKAEFLAPISPFHYHDPAQLVRTGGFPWSDLAVLLAVSALASALTVVVFHRRDIR